MRWARDLESPVVGIYVLDHDLNLASRAFHTVGVETLQHLDGLDWVDEFMRLKGVDQSDSRLKLVGCLCYLCRLEPFREFQLKH